MDAKITDPGNGDVGQILTKTEEGVEWATPEEVEQCECEELTEPELDEIMKGVVEEAIRGFEFIDLGLPSGNLWATCNLGAETEVDSGLYFQWGDTQGYKEAAKINQSNPPKDSHCFDKAHYIFTDSESWEFTKYNDIDRLKILEPEDDAASVMLGSEYKIPSIDDFYELIYNTTPGDGANENGWIENYKGSGVNGILLKSKMNNNTIFLIAAGGAGSNGIFGIGKRVELQSNKKQDDPDEYDYIFFTENFWEDVSNQRYNGEPIRAVKPKK